MTEPDACVVVHGWCGDTMEIYVKVDNGMNAEVAFMTDGCGPTVACGSTLVSMARGLPLDEAEQVSPDDLLEALGGLPEDGVHCSQLAVRTLHEAIANPRNEDQGGTHRYFRRESALVH
jgi:nitrogen fixation NifU-like protein